MKPQIRIENPCQQQWSELTANANGRFCTSCSKTVRDFSSLSDQQIIGILRNSSNVCGRFREDQLERELTDIKPVTFLSRIRQLAATVLLLLSGTALSAQDRKDKKVEQVCTLSSSTTKQTKAAIVGEVDVDSSKNMLRGILIDARDSLPVPYSTIYLGTINYFTTSDSAGRFCIVVPESDIRLTVILEGSGFAHVIPPKDIDLTVENTFVVRPITYSVGMSIMLIDGTTKKKHWWKRK